MSENSQTSSTGEQRHRAGLFDIRFIIALLIGVYGVICILTGFFTSDSDLDKADGLNLNLVAGIGMLVIGALFAVWARTRPIVVPDEPQDDSMDRPTH